jgi:hypothetical protein
VTALLLVGVLAVACGPRANGEESVEVEAFARSLRNAQAVAALSSTRVQGRLTDAERDLLTAAAERALDASRLVSDSVLAQLHPELPDRYRELFVESMRLRLEEMRGGGAEAESASIRPSAQTLMARWMVWYETHASAIRDNMR